MAKAMRGPEDIEQLQRRGPRDGERAARAGPGRGRRRGPRRSTRRSWWATPRCCRSSCGVSPESIAVAPYVATFIEPLDAPGRPDRLRRCTRSGGWRSTRRSAPTSAPTSWRTSSRPGSSAIRRRGSSSTWARTARSRAATPSARSRRRRRRDPRSRAARSSSACAPPRARSRASILTDGVVELQVIGGDVEPRGICGSGLIDIVAQLRLAGLLDDGGKMRAREDAEAAGPSARRAPRDARGRAAPSSCTARWCSPRPTSARCSSRRARSRPASRPRCASSALTADDLDEVMLAGSFGSYINPRSAQVVGLVPAVPVDKIKAVGNTASEGAKMALMSFREREVAWEIPNDRRVHRAVRGRGLQRPVHRQPGAAAPRHACPTRSRPVAPRRKRRDDPHGRSDRVHRVRRRRPGHRGDHRAHAAGTPTSTGSRATCT